MSPDLNRVLNVTQSLWPLFALAWRMLLILTACRSVFLLWQWAAIVAAGLVLPTLVEGLRFDLVLLSFVLAVPAACLPLLATNRVLLPAWRALLSTCLPAVLLALVAIECATPSFVDQLDGRPALFFFDYINEPPAVAAALWQVNSVPISLAFGVGSVLAWFSIRQLRRHVRSLRPVNVLPALLVMPLLLLGCAGLLRAGLSTAGQQASSTPGAYTIVMAVPTAAP